MDENENILRSEYFVTESGLRLPITLTSIEDDEGTFFNIDIDGVDWCQTNAQHHAVILFEMLKEHIDEYMHYVPHDQGGS